ncbi:hypothetical protein CsSME_00026174 [Camellia sinensis var. sinensis]|uniref:Geranylgeranyl diphosphate synthase n=2 Tax=Camellia sinensis TaxID=4442 RepID=A0A223HEC2_CAMSI|nr:geranylgeranyl diphosphate synthase [Camellia sinensis]AYQ58378.1 Geranylgeranyl pyrophosphate synthase 3 [Camellia sinensis]
MARALSHFTGKSSLPSLSKSNHSRPSSLSCYRPMMITMMAQSQPYWASIESDIEVHLKNAIHVRPPVTVFKPMHCLVFAAPKTKASALCVAACELVGGDRDRAMDAASAIHLMHAAAYTHEHLPLTDRPISKPMIHHTYGPNIELLTGDGIVPFGFELLARSVDPAQKNSGRILRVIIEITRAIGSLGVVDGRYTEIRGTQSNGEELRDEDTWMEHVCKKKVGEMHACGAACGAILGGGSEEEIEKLRKYGLHVGMIQGMMMMVNGLGRKEEREMEVVERLKVLALKELESFDAKKVDLISSLVESNLCNV